MHFQSKKQSIPVLITGRDVVGQAHTGSGKTAAFALAMLQQIQTKKWNSGINHGPNKRACNTNYNGELKKFAKHTKIKVATVYGGQGMGIQLRCIYIEE